MTQYRKTIRTGGYEFSFQLTDYGFEQNGTDGSYQPQVVVWQDGSLVDRFDVSREFGNVIYLRLRAVVDLYGNGNGAKSQALKIIEKMRKENRRASWTCDVSDMETRLGTSLICEP